MIPIVTLHDESIFVNPRAIAMIRKQETYVSGVKTDAWCIYVYDGIESDYFPIPEETVGEIVRLMQYQLD